MSVRLQMGIWVQQDLSEQTMLSYVDTGLSNGTGSAVDALKYIMDHGVSGGNQNFVEMISGYGGLWGEPINCGDGKTAVQCLRDELAYGPIVVWMKAVYGGNFRFDNYKNTGGIYHNTDILVSSPAEWHSVLLVGYSESQQCFKAKNSWGPNWGENRCGGLTGSRGYFRIGYDCVSSGVEFGVIAAGIHRDKSGDLLSGQLVYIQDNYDNFTITNTGNAAVSISGISSSQPWLSLGANSVSQILPGQSKTISLNVDWGEVDQDENATVTVVSGGMQSKINVFVYPVGVHATGTTDNGGGFYEPGSIYAIPISSSQINLSWDKGLNYGVDNLEYVVMRSKSSDISTARFVATTTDTDFRDINLESGTTYYYRVGSFVEMFKPEFGPRVTATTLGTPPSGGGGSSGDGTTPECSKPRKVTGARVK